MPPEMSASSPSPLDALITRDHPMLVAQFAKGASVARAAMSSADPENSVLIAPLRGAMPVYWSACGLESLQPDEDKPLPKTLEVPIGEFTYDSDGVDRTTSPKPHQKLQIVRTILANHASLETTPSHLNVFMLDEVQKGGTITTAVDVTSKALRELGLASTRPLNVIAAQDSRRKVMTQAKKSAYLKLASNSTVGVATTVVPMPLISTDRKVLLDKIESEGTVTTDTDLSNRLTVVRNAKAEKLFRTLGTLARDAEVRHDQPFIDALIEDQQLTTPKATARVEGWFAYVINVLDNFSLER